MLNYLKNKIRGFFFNRKFYIKIKEKNIFSVRKFGGATAGRAVSFFSKEPITINWINNFESDSNFLDIGANIGIYSLYAASKNIKVVSFEPESSNFYQLNLNILDNSFQNLIKAYPICAGDKLELGDLYLDTLKVGGSGHTFLSKISNAVSNNKELFIQGSLSISVDEFIDFSFFIPNYIKIDVDGNENLVVKGMSKILKNKKLKSILIEINNDNKLHRDSIDILIKNNFKIYGEEKYVKNIGNYIFVRQ
jgi:FkbM family methyltransferase